MRTSNIQFAEKFTANPNHRPQLAWIRVMDNRVLATDSYRALRITEKTPSVNIPDSVDTFFPELSEKKVKVQLSLLNQIAEIASKTNKNKRSACYLHFMKDKILIKSDGFLFQDIFIENPFKFFDVKFDATYLFSATKELVKKWFKDIFVDQETPEAPFLMVAENSEEKIEIIIMPLK